MSGPGLLKLKVCKFYIGIGTLYTEFANFPFQMSWARPQPDSFKNIIRRGGFTVLVAGRSTEFPTHYITLFCVATCQLWNSSSA
jgi:hypothetical protein